MTTAVMFTAAMSAFLALPQRVQGDDAVRRVMLEQLASGIKPDTKYSFIQPVLTIPTFWILDRLGFGIYAVTFHPIAWMTVWSLAVWKVLARERSASFAHHVVVLTVASLLGASLVGFSSDIFTALALSGGLIVGRLGRSPAARGVAWTVFVIGGANTPVTVAAVAVLAAYFVLVERRFRYMALPLAVFVLTVIESTAVSGTLSWTRYSSDIERGNLQLLPWGDVAGFGWPLWSGLLAVLFSFGRGLVFFVPTLWNGVTTKPPDLVRRVEHALWIIVLALLPIYSMWWAWFGGVSFGPRFFTIMVVPAALATASLISRRDRGMLRSSVAGLSIVLSWWVVVAGAVFGVTTTAFDWCASGGGFNNFLLCLYTPEYSGLWAPIWAADPVGARDVLFAAVMALFIAPTVRVALAPCVVPIRNQFNRAGIHLRGRWTI